MMIYSSRLELAFSIAWKWSGRQLIFAASNDHTSSSPSIIAEENSGLTPILRSDYLPHPAPTMASSSVPATPLLYSCIAHKNTILTEHTTSAASATSQLASVILPKISHDQPQKLTYTHNQNFIHYIADANTSSGSDDELASAAGLTYLVVARSDLGRRVPFGYLVEIKKRFLAEYDAQRTNFAGLPAYGAAAFNSQLKSLMVDYGTTKAGQEDAFKNVQSEIDNVRGIMTENIERVLERGERIDLLVDKTDRLGGSARDFRVRSRGLKRRMWWKNMKLMVLLVVVVIFLIYLLVGFGCGLPGKSTRQAHVAGRLADSSRSLGTLHTPLRVTAQHYEQRMSAPTPNLVSFAAFRASGHTRLYRVPPYPSIIKSSETLRLLYFSLRSHLCSHRALYTHPIAQTQLKHYPPTPTPPPTSPSHSYAPSTSPSPPPPAPTPQTPPAHPPPST